MSFRPFLRAGWNAKPKPLGHSIFIAKRNFFWSSKPAVVEAEIKLPKVETIDKIQPTLSPPTPIESPLPTESIQAPIVDSELYSNLVNKVASLPNGTELIDDFKLTAITQLGDLSSLGLASWYTPVGWFQNLLEATFVFTGLPWFGAIVLTTLLARLLLFKLSIKTQKNMVIFNRIKPEMDAISEKVKEYKRMGNSIAASSEQQKVVAIFRKENLSPLSPLLGIVQIPIFISMFMAVSKMSYLPVPGFETGGFGWITDLTASDPYFILPILSTFAMLASMEVF
jgi:YidC/Oxa1 family membrane protein insertase